jgi:hypothetical protein
MKHEVDVISMSFIIGEKSDYLKEVVENASKAGIIMTCSAHDEGSRIQQAYPAGHHTEDTTILRFAACDEYGIIHREDPKVQFDFKIRGNNVAAGVIPFLKSEETITGSSVSTAIAAGLSSLMLTCNRLRAKGGHCAEKQGKGQYELAKSGLETMAKGHGNFVPLDNYSRISDLRRDL